MTVLFRGETGARNEPLLMINAWSFLTCSCHPFVNPFFMAGSMSAADRQKLLLQQEIAKLSGKLAHSQFPLISGAISRHAANPSHQSSYHPYARGGSSTGRGTIRGRGTRGRGRGGYSLDLRKSTAPISEPKEAGEISKSPSPAPPPVTPATNWVKTNNKGNMSLMTAETKWV